VRYWPPRGGGRPWDVGTRPSRLPAPRAPLRNALFLCFCVLGCLVESLPSKGSWVVGVLLLRL
jgi:hypothetical protein